ncbi:MAG: RluA family pseudouridine synthase [Deltaproteobacteria bacterium]|nr:RluA family pseudouridine synthase [Deltaproteobacteria bacterium]
MTAAIQWAVQVDDGSQVRDVLAKARALGAQVGERVLLNGRSAGLDDPIEPGDLVDLWPPNPPSDAERVQILAHRDGILLANKPAGLPTESTPRGPDSLVSGIIQCLRGGPVHAASRLDVAVSGVVLCTLGRDAARRVQQWRDHGQLQRRYLAIVAGALSEEGDWDWPLGKIRDRGGRHRVGPQASRTRPARTHFVVRATIAAGPVLDCPASIVELRPATGRMHQLRAHASLAGAPILGDRTYGGPRQLVDSDGRVHELGRVALHARRVVLPSRSATAPIPTELRDWWHLLGGDDDDWHRSAE